MYLVTTKASPPIFSRKQCSATLVLLLDSLRLLVKVAWEIPLRILLVRGVMMDRVRCVRLISLHVMEQVKLAMVEVRYTICGFRSNAKESQGLSLRKLILEYPVVMKLVHVSIPQRNHFM
jgi:hypothetical protein